MVKQSLCLTFRWDKRNQNSEHSLSFALSWEQRQNQMDAVGCLLFLTPTCSSNNFSHFLDLFDIFGSRNLPPPPTLISHPTPSSLPLPSLPPPPLLPSRRGSRLRIIAFDRRGLWLRDWALAVESTGSIPPIPTLGSHCAWWQCWHSTCSPTGLIKSAASIWMQGQWGPRQHGHMCTTVQYTLHKYTGNAHNTHIDISPKHH